MSQFDPESDEFRPTSARDIRFLEHFKGQNLLGYWASWSNTNDYYDSTKVKIVRIGVDSTIHFLPQGLDSIYLDLPYWFEGFDVEVTRYFKNKSSLSIFGTHTNPKMEILSIDKNVITDEFNIQIINPYRFHPTIQVKQINLNNNSEVKIDSIEIQYPNPSYRNYIIHGNNKIINTEYQIIINDIGANNPISETITINDRDIYSDYDLRFSKDVNDVYSMGNISFPKYDSKYMKYYTSFEVSIVSQDSITESNSHIYNNKNDGQWNQQNKRNFNFNVEPNYRYRSEIQVVTINEDTLEYFTDYTTVKLPYDTFIDQLRITNIEVDKRGVTYYFNNTFPRPIQLLVFFANSRGELTTHPQDTLSINSGVSSYTINELDKNQEYTIRWSTIYIHYISKKVKSVARIINQPKLELYTDGTGQGFYPMNLLNNVIHIFSNPFYKSNLLLKKSGKQNINYVHVINNYRISDYFVEVQDNIGPQSLYYNLNDMSLFSYYSNLKNQWIIEDLLFEKTLPINGVDLVLPALTTNDTNTNRAFYTFDKDTVTYFEKENIDCEFIKKNSFTFNSSLIFPITTYNQTIYGKTTDGWLVSIDNQGNLSYELQFNGQLINHKDFSFWDIDRENNKIHLYNLLDKSTTFYTYFKPIDMDIEELYVLYDEDNIAPTLVYLLDLEWYYQSLNLNYNIRKRFDSNLFLTHSNPSTPLIIFFSNNNTSSFYFFNRDHNIIIENYN